MCIRDSTKAGTCGLLLDVPEGKAGFLGFCFNWQFPPNPLMDWHFDKLRVTYKTFCQLMWLMECITGALLERGDNMLFPGCGESLWNDGLLYKLQTNSSQTPIIRLQRHLDSLMDWTDNWKVVIKPTNSVTVLFSKRQKNPWRNLKLGQGRWEGGMRPDPPPKDRKKMNFLCLNF